MKLESDILTDLTHSKQETPCETLESLGLVWLREETDKATEIMLKAFKAQHTNPNSQPAP